MQVIYGKHLKNNFFNQRLDEARGFRQFSPEQVRLSRRSKIWVPLNKRLIFSGIRRGNVVVSTAKGITEALATAWSPTFAPKSIDIAKARKYIERGNLHKPSPSTPPPSEHDIAYFLAKSVDSGVRPDGICYSGCIAGRTRDE